MRGFSCLRTGGFERVTSGASERGASLKSVSHHRDGLALARALAARAQNPVALL